MLLVFLIVGYFSVVGLNILIVYTLLLPNFAETVLGPSSGIIGFLEDAAASAAVLTSGSIIFVPLTTTGFLGSSGYLCPLFFFKPYCKAFL